MHSLITFNFLCHFLLFSALLNSDFLIYWFFIFYPFNVLFLTDFTFYSCKLLYFTLFWFTMLLSLPSLFCIHYFLHFPLPSPPLSFSYSFLCRHSHVVQVGLFWKCSSPPSASGALRVGFTGTCHHTQMFPDFWSYDQPTWLNKSRNLCFVIFSFRHFIFSA